MLSLLATKVKMVSVQNLVTRAFPNMSRCRRSRLEQFVGFALGAADRAYLLEFFLGFEHIALFGMPHAEIRPSQRVVGIGGERSLVPEFASS